jgi:poly [ADP-ribose] polymerase
MVSKSAEYCAPTKDKPNALMLVCDVALGRPFQVAHTKFVSKEDLDQYNYHSVKGCGEWAPDAAFDSTVGDSVVIAMGKEARTGVIRSELPHNEFVVYDVRQIRVKYLLWLKVVSKTGQDIKAHSLVNAN